MKKSILFATILMAWALATHAQTDTMYVMKAGVVVKKYNIHTQIDSVIFYQPITEEPVETSGTFTDGRDGNTYKWVKIGNQVWMAENLKYLPSVVAATTGSLTEPHYYVYGYHGTKVSGAKTMPSYAAYGVLYNWPAAMGGAASSESNPSGVRGVCPTGWHMPSDAEWGQLIDYMGNSGLAADKLKEKGSTHWNVQNTNANNQSGFTALPGGSRETGGTFINSTNKGNWWTTSEVYDTNARNISMSALSSNVSKAIISKGIGNSVRCVKD